MATSTELAKTRVITRDGVVTATLVDRVGPDRIYRTLVRGAAAARYGSVADDTPRVSREIRNLLVNPKPEDG